MRVEEIKSRINFNFYFVGDNVGMSGVLCFPARDVDTFKLLSFSNNHIYVEVKDRENVWRVTDFYGFPERQIIDESWDLLRRLSSVSHLPWVIIGNFNDVLLVRDKKKANLSTRIGYIMTFKAQSWTMIFQIFLLKVINSDGSTSGYC